MAVTKVLMPKLSEAMETGKIIKWLKREGESVRGGDVIAEVETDKADVEMEAFGAGVLRKILAAAGERVPVGQMIAVIADPADDIAGLLGAAAAAPQASVPAPVAPPAEAAPAAPVTAAAPEVAAPAPAAVAPGVAPARVKASPLARKIAAQAGLDVRSLQGSGPGGRIVRRDVEAAIARGAVAPAAAAPVAPAVAAPVPVSAVVAGPEYEDRPLSQMRATIAKRMPLAKGPVPHFYVTTEVAMDRAAELREQLNALEGQPRISVNDMVVRAAAIALLHHPGVNASFQGETVRVYHRAHIGIAVALEEGLITPVLRDCQAKSLTRIAVEGTDLVERARARRLKAPELSGATFSISNLGMFDVAEFSAIINPPEGAILAVGAIRKVPVVAGDALAVGRRMSLTLSCDHRVMDGAMGARFLQEVKRLLEEPLRLLA